MNSYIDMHCDTLQRTFTQGASSLYDGEGMQSIKLMQEAKQMCQFFACSSRQEMFHMQMEH